MYRFAVLALTLLICSASFSCQTYTSGLQQSLAHADEAAATATLRTITLAQKPTRSVMRAAMEPFNSCALVAIWSRASTPTSPPLRIMF